MIPVILDQRVQETKSRTTADGHIIRTTNSQCNFTEKNKKDAPDLPPPLKSGVHRAVMDCVFMRHIEVSGSYRTSCPLMFYAGIMGRVL